MEPLNSFASPNTLSSSIVLTSLSLIITLPLMFSALTINYLQDFLWFTFFNLVFFALNFIVGYLLVSYFYKGSYIDNFVISLILLITEEAIIKVIQALVILIFSPNFIFYGGIYVFSPYY